MSATDAPWAGRRCIVVGADGLADRLVGRLVADGAEVHRVVTHEPARRVPGIASLSVTGTPALLHGPAARIGAVVDAAFDLRNAPLDERAGELRDCVLPLMVLGGVVVLRAPQAAQAPAAPPPERWPGPDGAVVGVETVPGAVPEEALVEALLDAARRGAPHRETRAAGEDPARSPGGVL